MYKRDIMNSNRHEIIASKIDIKFEMKENTFETII